MEKENESNLSGVHIPRADQTQSLGCAPTKISPLAKNHRLRSCTIHLFFYVTLDS